MEIFERIFYNMHDIKCAETIFVEDQFIPFVDIAVCFDISIEYGREYFTQTRSVPPEKIMGNLEYRNLLHHRKVAINPTWMVRYTIQKAQKLMVDIDETCKSFGV
jgi:hypothetical protein